MWGYYRILVFFKEFIVHKFMILFVLFCGLFSNTLAANSGIAEKTWMDLATSVQRAQSIAQFSGTRRVGVGSARVSPQAQKVADQLDLDPTQVAQMQQMARDPANLAALQQLIGIEK